MKMKVKYEDDGWMSEIVSVSVGQCSHWDVMYFNADSADFSHSENLHFKWTV